MKRWGRLVLLLLLFLGLAARPDEVPADSGGTGTRRALIVCGLPGDDEHHTLYAGAVAKIASGLAKHCGFAASGVWVRFGDVAPGGATFGPAANRGPADRAGIEADVAELRRQLTPEDALWVIVLGHGHYDGRHSHLNLPGRDPDERDFAALFAGLAAREQVFFITTSASGFFVKPLSAPGRVVIAATEPDREVNETVFPLALADLLAAPPPEADRDDDGVISLLELYLTVVIDTLQRFAGADPEQIPSEHARLDDNGDGHGSEVQQSALPPELGGLPRKKGKDKEKTPARKPDSKDDGALAAKLRVARPVISKTVENEAGRQGQRSPQ
jgi:hypothetical protein